MDERLKGLQVKDITLSKVNELLTPEEKLMTCTKVVRSWEYNSYSICNTDDLNTLYNDVLDILKDYLDVEICIVDNEVIVEYYRNKTIDVPVKEFFRDKWREEIEINDEKEKEYKLYLELEDKFDNASGEPSEH